MYLSELYGRIGQMLREHGDMKIQRYRSLKLDGIMGSNLNNFIDFSSEDFSILDDNEVTQVGENIYEIKKVGQRFIIHIP